MKFLPAIFFLLIIASCTYKPKYSVSDISDDEYEVINLVLEKAVENDVLFKQYALEMDSITPLFPPPLKKKSRIEEAREINKRGLHFDSLKKALSVTQLRLYISDSLYKFPAKYFRPSTADKITSYDDDTLRMIKKIVPALDTITKASLLDTSRIKPVFNYKKIWFRYKSPRRETEVSPGEIFISRGAFTQDHSAACIYVEGYHGPKWANGKLIYLMKKRTGWVILRIVRLWVS